MTTSRRSSRICGHSKSNATAADLFAPRSRPAIEVERPDAPVEKNVARAARSRFPLRAWQSGLKLALPSCVLAADGIGVSGDQRRRETGQLRLSRLPHRPVQHPHGERQKVPLAVFPTNSFARSVHSSWIARTATRASRNWCTTRNCRRPTAPAATTRRLRITPRASTA